MTAVRQDDDLAAVFIGGYVHFKEMMSRDSQLTRGSLGMGNFM